MLKEAWTGMRKQPLLLVLVLVMLLLQLQLLLLSHALGNAATATKATTAGSCTGNANTATTANSAKTCTGNSATASKLATARNIKLQGAVSGNANFDGSANITINTTQANIATLTGSVKNEKTLSYPSGFNKSNCVVISAMFDGPSTAVSWTTGALFNSSGYVKGGIPFEITLSDTGITLTRRIINIGNGVTPTVSDDMANSANFKIVLMKI